YLTLPFSLLSFSDLTSAVSLTLFGCHRLIKSPDQSATDTHTHTNTLAGERVRPLAFNQPSRQKMILTGLRDAVDHLQPTHTHTHTLSSDHLHQHSTGQL